MKTIKIAGQDSTLAWWHERAPWSLEELTQVIAPEFEKPGETTGEIITRFQNSESAARKIAQQQAGGYKMNHNVCPPECVQSPKNATVPTRQVIPAEAARAAFITLYDRPHIEGVSISDMRRALEAAGAYMQGRVTTEEELDTLPVGTVVLSDKVTHHEGGWAIAYQRWQDGDWHRGGRSGSTHPGNFLPVTILHRPAL